MAKESTAAVYDESKITTLSSLEHIRLRPGMYIGRLGNGTHPNDGIYVLVKEIIDNSIDEHIMGYGKRIRVKLDGKRVSVRDFGRGIPLGKLVDCVSIINTGAKYNDDVFQFSIGLNGVGTKAVNSLSHLFKITSYRLSTKVEAKFHRGTLVSPAEENATDEPDGTLVEFEPDPEIFVNYSYQYEYVKKLLKNYSYLNCELNFYLNREKFRAKNGLYDLLTEEVGESRLYEVIHCKSDRIELAITHTDDYGENYFSYVNGHYTSDGGSHLSAFREGILKAVNEFFKSNYQGPDVRDGLVGAVAVRVKEPVFESQTKNKLGNTDVRGWIVTETKRLFLDFLYKNPESTEKLQKKVQTNERLRRELSNVKKAVRDRTKKTALVIPKLKDCKYHLGDKHPKGVESTVFLTEGQSAGGSLVSCRDVMTQAIFCLKGKPLNCWNQGRDAIYKNEELYNVMKVLGLEESLDGLRYNKVVIATDADVDGFHIRNLLLTFFLHYFEGLVLNGHVYILETPLFRVRNQKATQYCYSNQEKEEAIAELKKGKQLEITRFKGLGEISPNEFGQFIGTDMRATKVGVEHIHDARDLLTFYMGKNTDTRKRYIMENLI
ncbi:MAG: type IIA DNA topoisomerase subunit B [SAR324 cluster bacterium]|nr:type IIA DNA topoisomerase subunit B [SAR324 cluster bacterium]